MLKYSALIGVAILFAVGLFGLATASAAPAGAATGLRIAQEGCTNGSAKARLSWTPSGQGSQRVDLSATNNNFASNYSSGSVGNGNATQLTNLTPGTTYYARVVTMANSGQKASDTLAFTASCAVTAFAAPRNLQAASMPNGSVRFLWSPGENNKWFCVDTARNVADLMSLKNTWRNHCRTDANSLTVSGLRCGTTYVWAVYAWNGNLNAKSATTTVQTQPCVIGKPTDLKFRQTGNDAVRLSWTAGQNNRWFCVDVAESEKDLNKFGPTWQNFNCWSTRTSLDLEEVECGKVYYFNVHAWNEHVNTRSANSTFELEECTAKVVAEIENLEISTTDDDPKHYILTVVAVLPNDCYEFDSKKVTQNGRTITVTVTNLLDKDGSCSKKASTYEFDIDLGTNFPPGNRYTVNVNDERIRFTAE
jgi:hypothetical protein